MNVEDLIISLERRLHDTLDPDERHRLLRLLIKEMDRFGRDSKFRTTIERHIAHTEDCINRQKDLVACLKREGRDTRDAYFLLVTMKTLSVLFAHHYEMAKEVLVIIVPGKK